MALQGIEPLAVKSGDEVCYIPVYPKNGKPEEWEILTVDYVTARAGQIVTKDGRRFDKEGMERGGEVSPSGSRATLHTLTDELRARMTRAKRIGFLNSYNWQRLADFSTPAACDAMLEEVVALFRKYQIELEGKVLA